MRRNADEGEPVVIEPIEVKLVLRTIAIEISDIAVANTIHPD